MIIIIVIVIITITITTATAKSSSMYYMITSICLLPAARVY